MTTETVVSSVRSVGELVLSAGVSVSLLTNSTRNTVGILGTAVIRSMGEVRMASGPFVTLGLTLFGATSRALMNGGLTSEHRMTSFEWASGPLGTLVVSFIGSTGMTVGNLGAIVMGYTSEVMVGTSPLVVRSTSEVTMGSGPLVFFSNSTSNTVGILGALVMGYAGEVMSGPLVVRVASKMMLRPGPLVLLADVSWVSSTRRTSVMTVLAMLSLVTIGFASTVMPVLIGQHGHRHRTRQ